MTYHYHRSPSKREKVKDIMKNKKTASYEAKDTIDYEQFLLNNRNRVNHSFNRLL